MLYNNFYKNWETEITSINSLVGLVGQDIDNMSVHYNI